jgi:flagellar FliL protein
MADEEVEESSEGGGGANKLMLVLIVLIVLLIGAVGAGGYILYSKGVFSDQPPQAQEGEQQAQAKAAEPQKSEASDEGGPSVNVSIEDLILNITTAKGREKLMKLSFTLKCAAEGCEQIIENVKPEIQDVVIEQTSSRSVEELLTVGGKQLFKEELLDEINNIVNEATKGNEDIKKNIIKRLYFTTFVIK